MGEFCGRIQNIAINYPLHYAGLDFSDHCRLASRWTRGSVVDERAALPGRETAASSSGTPRGDPGKNVFMADCLLAAVARSFPERETIERGLEQVFNIQREAGHRIRAGGETVAAPALLGSHRQAGRAVRALHDCLTHRLETRLRVERLCSSRKVT